MSWMARKIAGLDNEDNRKIYQEYFKIKEKERLLLEQDREIKKFWNEYEDEYYNG